MVGCVVDAETTERVVIIYVVEVSHEYFVPSSDLDVWREIKANVPCLAYRQAG